jgi:ubiquinone/menaquinone biosynthesis C-methylase UbiE
LANDHAEAKRVVEQGYDRIAERYAAWTGDSWGQERGHYGSLVIERLPRGAAVLELGCGTGVPVTRELAQHFAVTGVDLSARSIALARQNVPTATFLHADMASVQFPAASFDAVVAFYSIIHVPRQEHPCLLQSIARWLRPGGLFVASMGAGTSEDWYEDDWLGVPMYWSHYDGETNQRLVADAGLEVLDATVTTEIEDGDRVTFLWVVGRKPVGE